MSGVLLLPAWFLFAVEDNFTEKGKVLYGIGRYGNRISLTMPLDGREK